MKKSHSFVLLLFEFAVLCFGLHYLHIGLSVSHSDDMRIIMPILVDIAFLALFASFGRRLALFFGIAPMAGKMVTGILVGPALFGVLGSGDTGVELARVAGVLFILFEAGLHFDPVLLFSFMQSIDTYPVGLIVQLRSNRIGVVLDNGRRASRPKVLAFYSTREKAWIDNEIVMIGETLSRDAILANVAPADWGISQSDIDAMLNGRATKRQLAG